MELFYAKGTVAMAVLITLYETGLPFTITSLDFSKAEQQDATYLARNPKGRVPALNRPRRLDRNSCDPALRGGARPCSQPVANGPI